MVSHALVGSPRIVFMVAWTHSSGDHREARKSRYMQGHYFCCTLLTEASHTARLIGWAHKLHSLFLGERNCKLAIQRMWLQIGMKNLSYFYNQSAPVDKRLGYGDLFGSSTNLLCERGILP